jgi:hypothetical protein
MFIFVENASAAIPTKIASDRIRELLHLHRQPQRQHVNRSRGCNGGQRATEEDGRYQLAML